MTFGAPLMLWSLAALIPLTAIYLLKVRPRRRPTTALFLWKQILQERRAHHLLHRLRDVWSLLLMMAAFAGVAFALAEPRWSSDENRDLLVLIDASASMQARDGSTTRLARAQDRVRDIARAMDGVQRLAVATISHDLRFLSHLSDNPREILAAIERVEPTQQEFNLRALPREPKANAQREAAGVELVDFQEALDGGYRVLLVSDGSFDTTALPAHVELLRVGEPQENLGIVAADLDFVPGHNDQLRLFYQVASSAKETRELDLLLSFTEGEVSELKKVIPLTVQPGVNDPQVLVIEGAEPGRWVAQLDHDDALPTDDTAYLVARRPPPVTIAVESANRFFLEQSILAFERAGDLLQLVAEGPQVVLAQGTVPESPRSIILGPEGDSPWWESLGEGVEVSAPRVLVKDHPLLTHIDPTTIHFVGARRITPPPGTQVLVDSPEGVPLIYITHQGGSSAVVVNLEPLAAEFYFSAWFPVLVHSAAMHLVGREEPLSATYPPNATVPIPGPENDDYQITIPSGQQRDVRGKRFDELTELGFYHLQAGEASGPVACSLLSTQETLLDSGEETAEVMALASGLPPSYWLTVLAILVLTTESILYHRRKVG